MVAAYLIKYKDMTAEEAISFMQSKRAVVNPNPGFRKQLAEFEQELKQS